MKDLTVKIYADGADIEDMMTAYKSGNIQGFTTNPSLMKKAGIADYEAFAKEAVSKIPDMPISFEVFSDDFDVMEQEARKIASWGDNVYIKIPIMNSKGESSIPLIKKLSGLGFSLNVTALFAIKQVEDTVAAFAPGTKNIVSVFAGRIADSGVDPIPTMKQAAEICRKVEGSQLLWASCREVINIYQADECGCEIITVPPGVVSKLSGIGTPLEQLSLDTVQTFNKDIQALGYSIL